MTLTTSIFLRRASVYWASVLTTSLVIAAPPSPSEALKAATETARGIEARTSTPPKSKLPSGDPCTMLSNDDVRKAFPGAKPGERSRRLEKYGMTECQWKGPDGDLVLIAQESINSGGSAKDAAQGMADGIADPLKPGSRKSVRIETLSGVPVDNAAFIEAADPKRGILGDGAMLALRKGARGILLNAPSLPERDRTAALKTFENLGRAASARLTAPD